MMTLKLMQAHGLSVFIVVASMLITPFYVFATYVFSGASYRNRHNSEIPPKAVIFLIVIGVADFISAFFFGFTSSATPLQLFYPDIPNKIILFPTGMIPLFLVLYAIFFHTLSALNYAMHR